MERGNLVNAVLEAHDVVARHSRMLGLAGLAARNHTIDIIQALQDASGIRSMLEDIQRREAVMRAATGPFEELRRTGIFGYSSLFSNETEAACHRVAQWEARFYLPEIADTARLMNLHANSVLEVLKRYTGEISSLKLAIESVRTPWLDLTDSMRSMGGFAALQGIGHALNKMPPFGNHLTTALRVDLGDWRDTITWPAEIFKDLRARSEFYVAQGFNTALTDFPGLAFQESLEIAGLRGEPPSLIDLYGSPISTSNDDEEAGLARTNTAHDWLFRLETQVRRFINEEMTRAFGPDWPKHRLTNGLYDQWQEKRRKAQQSGGRECALIAYADFTDYVLVICKSDNWSIFAPFFGRQEDVRETFQRLYPIRLDTMHARPITQDDELLLYVEIRRLVKLMIGEKP